MHSRDSRKESPVRTLRSNCLKCDLDFDGQDDFQCMACADHYHKKKECSGIPASVFKASSGNSQVILLCPNCKDIDLHSILKRITVIENKLLSMERKTNEEMISTAVVEAVEEFKDIESRKNNLIVFGIPEKESGSGAEKKMHDENHICKLAEILDVESPDITTFFRLGQKRAGHRPIKIVFNDPQHRHTMLSRARNLRNLGESNWLRKVFVKPDLTPRQQEVDRRLRESLKLRREAGESVMIKGGRIVQIRNPVKFPLQ